MHVSVYSFALPHRSLSLSPFPLFLSFPGPLSSTGLFDRCRLNTPSGLREEFEMDSRLRKIESKLSMLQQNTNFFIEMLHNQKRFVRSFPCK